MATPTRTEATAPQRLMSVVGLGATLQVKVIPPLWDAETGRVTCVRNGGLLFDFVPHDTTSSRGWIRFSLTLPECGKVLLMDRAAGLQLVHHRRHPKGQEVKTVEWVPASSDSEMELRVLHTDEAQGVNRSFRLPLPPANLALMQELLEHSIPTVTGFDCAPANPQSGWAVAGLGFYKETAGLFITYSGPSDDNDTAQESLGLLAKEGRLICKFAPRGSSHSGSGPAFDWATSVSFALRADDCAELATMSPETDGVFTRTPASADEPEKMMTVSKTPDGTGVVITACGKGLSLQVPLAWAELKVIQVVGQSLIPHMLGLGWL
eukprot:EG_transcript_14897